MLRQGGEKLDDGRWRSGPAERNKGPILEILRRFLPPAGLVLEIASGTGQHVAHFAQALPGLTWQPSDADAELRASVALWTREERLANVNVPLELDVCRFPWPLARADAIVCINMIHVAPWAAAQGLFRGAGKVLSAGGIVFLYGPYRRFGRHTALSNKAFDAQLRAQDPGWGLRDMEEIGRIAGKEGIDLVATIEMPANNFSLVLRKSVAAPG